MAEISIYDISGLATAVCALTAMSYKRPYRLGAFLFLAVMFWAIGMSGATRTYNMSVPERAMLIDRVLMVHLTILPVYALLYISRSDHSVAYLAAAGAAVATVGILVYALTQQKGESVAMIKYASRGVIVMLVALLVIMISPSVPQHPGYAARPMFELENNNSMLPVAIFLVEALYAGIFAYVEPVGASTIETITTAVGREPVAEPTKPTSCAPMCVGTSSSENACYEHNARLEQLYRDVTLNKRAGVPEFSGMTATERACLRAHPIGSKCTYCQGNGCMRAPIQGVVCTDNAKAHEALLATVNEESKRQTQSGFGVLSFDEQLAQARNAKQ